MHECQVPPQTQGVRICISTRRPGELRSMCEKHWAKVQGSFFHPDTFSGSLWPGGNHPNSATSSQSTHAASSQLIPSYSTFSNSTNHNFVCAVPSARMPFREQGDHTQPSKPSPQTSSRKPSGTPPPHTRTHCSFL